MNRSSIERQIFRELFALSVDPVVHTRRSCKLQFVFYRSPSAVDFDARLQKYPIAFH